jgi:chitodextrinase
MTARRRRAVFAVVTLLSLLLVTPGIVAAAADQAYDGTLVVAHGDDIDANGVAHGPGVYDYSLETSSGTVRLAFSGAAPEGFWNGAHVRVRGSLAGGTLAVAAGGTNATVVAATTVAASATKKVAVLLLNFLTNTTQPWTVSQAQGIMFGNTNSVANYFAEESFGQVSVTGDVFGYYTLDVDTSTCNYSDIATKARAAATAAGVNLSLYTNVQYAFPNLPCGWSGLAYMPGSETWVNNALGLYVSGHELSHNFGVHHASTLNCVESGVRVALSASLANCTASEYGDPFSVMGNGGGRHTHGQQLATLGWLSGTNLQTVTTTGTYTLTSADDSGTGVKSMRVARGDGTYLYLELRQPVGSQFDNFSASDPDVNGVSLRIANDWTTIIQSKLIDTTPATSTYNDAALAVDASFTDPLSGVTFTTVSVSSVSRSAQVSISWSGGGGAPDTTAPSAPGGLGAALTGATTASLSWSASTDNVGVAGYRVSRDGNLLGTVTTTQMNDSGLVAGSTYSYSVVAFDAAGNASQPATTSLFVPLPGDTTAPLAPANLRVSSLAGSRLNLAWDASTDNVGVTAYRLYKGGKLTATLSGTTTTWSDRSIPSSATYYVVAVDAAGNASSPSATLAWPAFDVLAPTAPANLRITSLSASKVSLAWDAATDDLGVKGYYLYRDGTRIATLTRLYDSISRTSASATYWVVAFDYNGNLSLPSTSVTVAAK